MQAHTAMGGVAALPFWDTVGGLVARSWRLGVGDAVDALYRLDALWPTARDLAPPACPGRRLVGEAVALTAGLGHADVTRDAVALLTWADRLVPADVDDAGLCEALLGTLA